MYLFRQNKKFYIRCLMFAVSGILAGIFFAVKGGLSGVEKPNVFSNDYLHEYACLAIDSKKLFWIVVKERGKWFFLLWAFGLTGAGVWASGIFPALWGFFGSVFFAQAFLKQGAAGLVLGILFQLPQILVYIPLFAWSLYQMTQKSRQIRNRKKMGIAGTVQGVYLRHFLAALAILLLGILTESYINSYMVQLILQIFY